MATSLLPCPHCNAERVGFTYIWERQMEEPYFGNTAFQCGLLCTACGEIVVAHMWRSSAATSPINNGGADDPLKAKFRLIRTYPSGRQLKSPNYVPQAIAGYYVQAADNAARRHYDASGSMSRKVVDVTTKHLIPTEAPVRKKNIYDRIEHLKNEGALTKDLADWAHHVRLEGNDAVHEEEPFTKEQADELVKFAELFLTYVFTLPGQLKAARGEPEETE